MPNRIDFDPFPWQSFAIWILTQMKRWGQIKGDVDYKAVAEQVYLATDTAKLMREVGLTPPDRDIQELHGHGQGLRSRQARRIRQQLRDQAGMMLEISIIGPAAPAAAAVVSLLLFARRSSLAGTSRPPAAVRPRRWIPEYAKLMGATATPRQIGDAGPARGRREGLGAPEEPVL